MSRSTCIARRSGPRPPPTPAASRRAPDAQTGARSLNAAATHGRHLAARLERPPRSGDSLLRRRSRSTASNSRAARRIASMPARRRCPITRLRCRRRLATRRTTRPSAISTVTANTKSCCTRPAWQRQLAARRHRCADLPGVQTRRHPALDHQSRAQRPRRRALHAVPGVRLRRRRPRRIRLQDRRRHHRRHRQGDRRRQAPTGSRPNPPGEARRGDGAAPRGHERRRLHPERAGISHRVRWPDRQGAGQRDLSTAAPSRHRQPDARADEGDLGRWPRQPHRPFPRRRRLSRRRATRAS